MVKIQCKYRDFLFRSCVLFI